MGVWMHSFLKYKIVLAATPFNFSTTNSYSQTGKTSGIYEPTGSNYAIDPISIRISKNEVNRCVQIKLLFFFYINVIWPTRNVQNDKNARRQMDANVQFCKSK